MFIEDVTLAKEALDRATALIDARMNMIEKVDNHPLSWPVATEYQKLKRARTDDEDDKLFAAAEKKVKDENMQLWNIQFLFLFSYVKGEFVNLAPY